MPRKKMIEAPEVNDIIAPVKQKKPSFAVDWFNDYAVNNKSELKMVCELTARSAEEQFSLYLKSRNSETYAAIFYGTFMAIMQFLREKQKQYKNFAIVIANSINIGYCNNDNKENEKLGNFMPILEYVGTNRTVVDSMSKFQSERTASNFIRWKELNTRQNIEYYKSIQEIAYDYLKREFRISLRSSEAVFPLFCTFLDNVVNVLKQKFHELEDTDISEVSMNVLGLFDCYYSYNADDDKEIIDYVPNIACKLICKSDQNSSDIEI